MLRKLSILVAVSGLLGAGIAAEAQVVFTPIGQSGMPGDTVEIHISTSGPSAPELTIANLVLAYDQSASVWDPVTDQSGAVDCVAASDLADHVRPAPVRSQPDRGRIVMGFGDLESPLTPFGRGGIVLSCRVTIRPDAIPGTYPLVCGEDADASDAYNNVIPATCAGGSLAVEGAGAARAGAPVGRQVAPGAGPAPVIGEAVVAGGAAAGAAGGQAPAAGVGVAAPKAAPAGAVAREAAAPQAPAPGAGETGTAPGLPQGPAGVATALQPAAGTPKGSPAAPTAAATAAAPTPVAAATKAAAVKSPAPAATAAKAQQAAPKPTAKESGCAMSPQNESGRGWVPAVPLIALLLLRRRRR